MTPLRTFATTVLASCFVLGACSELIGLSDYEKGDVRDGEGGEDSRGGSAGKGGKGGSGNGGSSGDQGGGGTSGSRGGAQTGGRSGNGGSDPGGEGGDAGAGGESEGGTAGMTGGSAGRGGASGGGMGGMGGMGGGGAGNAGGGLGGTAGGGTSGAAGGGQGGSAGGSCTTVTLPLRSPGFDTDTAAWVQYDDGTGPPRPPVIRSAASEGITAHSPPNVANVCGRDDIFQEGHFQQITIPAGAVTLTLSGYRQVITEESGSTVYDRVRIQIYEDALTGTGFLGEFATFTNADANTGWLPFMGSLAVDSRAGQMVDLDMWAVSDVSYITDVYIDSLTLTAFVCN